MSAQSKIDRAKYGPSLTEVTLGAVLSILLGGAIAVAYLMTRPVLTVRELPEEPARHQVYFIEGGRQAPSQAQVLRKRQMLIAGASGEIALSEAELNALVASTQTAEAGEGGGWFKAQGFNFRVSDDHLQVAVSGTLDLFGLHSRPLIVQARGGFAGREGRFRYAAEELWVGSLPAHRLPGVSGILLSRLWKSWNLPEELTTAWGRLREVKVVGDQLVMTLP
jgi:hypothetical protein